jgi:pimeloyl-ACP methyl ester carboxylesterase
VRRRLIRGGSVLATALVLLWLGLGTPHRTMPRYASERLDADGVHVRAIRAGHGDTTLVFLHGFGESLMAWRPLLDRFDRHYRILAFDLPGFGLSDKPAGLYDYASYLRWLDDFIARATSGPLVLIGHSMGGQLAAGLALQHPDRVVAMVLIAPAGDGISPLLSDSEGIASPATTWVVSALGYVLPEHDSTWLREPPADLAYQPVQDSAAARAVRQVLGHFDFAAVGTDFSAIRQPVLLIWGREDPTIPFEIGERIADQLPCRRFVPLLALHRPHQSLPDTVAAEIRVFLQHPACGG